MADIIPFPIRDLPKGWLDDMDRYNDAELISALRFMRHRVNQKLKDGRMQMNPELEIMLPRLDAYLERYRHLG